MGGHMTNLLSSTARNPITIDADQEARGGAPPSAHRHHLVAVAHARRIERAPGTEERRPPAIGVGRAETPTPGGTFYIKELLRPKNPDGPYGPYAFGLSGYSNVITDSDQFGDGVIGIHGTNEPQLVGTDVSHGCIRLRNEDLDQLVGLLPLGTPVVVQA